jgi:hypothetical protein
MVREPLPLDRRSKIPRHGPPAQWPAGAICLKLEEKLSFPLRPFTFSDVERCYQYRMHGRRRLLAIPDATAATEILNKPQ